jgi:hypothetical protein
MTEVIGWRRGVVQLIRGKVLLRCGYECPLAPANERVVLARGR